MLMPEEVTSYANPVLLLRDIHLNVRETIISHDLALSGGINCK